MRQVPVPGETRDKEPAPWGSHAVVVPPLSAGSGRIALARAGAQVTDGQGWAAGSAPKPLLYHAPLLHSGSPTAGYRNRIDIRASGSRMAAARCAGLNLDTYLLGERNYGEERESRVRMLLNAMFEKLSI